MPAAPSPPPSLPSSPSARAHRHCTARAQLVAGIELVLAIERSRSISKAAASLGMTQSAASKQLQALEELVGAPLFKRTTRSISPSDAGQMLLGAGKNLLHDADLLLEQLRQANSAPGLLKIASGPLFGQKHILPHLQSFRDAHPGIEIRLTLSYDEVDLVRDEIDLLLHIGHLPDRRLVASRIAQQRRVLCAAPSYLARRGAPASPRELARHPCLVHTRLAPTGVWHCWQGDEVQAIEVAGPMASNSSEALLRSAVQGWGLALLPSWAVHDDLRSGALVEVLPGCRFDTDLQPRDISFLWVPQLSHSRPLRSCTQYFSEAFGRPPYWDRQAPAGA